VDFFSLPAKSAVYSVVDDRSVHIDVCLSIEFVGIGPLAWRLALRFGVHRRRLSCM